MKSNQEILDHVEALNGGYVWEREIFAISLLNASIRDADAAVLQDLRGVQQIALDATHLSASALEGIARIPDLESLVLFGSRLSDQQLSALERIGPEIVLIDER